MTKAAGETPQSSEAGAYAAGWRDASAGAAYGETAPADEGRDYAAGWRDASNGALYGESLRPGSEVSSSHHRCYSFLLFVIPYGDVGAAARLPSRK